MTEDSPIDDLDFDGVSNNNEYVITNRNKRYMLIACAILLINLLVLGFDDYLSGIFYDLLFAKNQVLTILDLGAQLYVYFFMMKYFEHYGLFDLRKRTWYLLLIEGAVQLSAFIGGFGISIPEVISRVLGILLFIVFIRWIIKIVKLKKTDFVGSISLFEYAVTSVVTAIISAIVALVITLYFVDVMTSLFKFVYLLNAIPYYFIIKFTLELKLKEDKI